MNDFVKEDFTYYERSIKAFYRKIFMRRIMWSGLLLILLVILATLEKSFVLLSAILTIGSVWYIYIQMQKMNDFSNKFLEEQNKWSALFEKENYEEQISSIFESQKKYFIELKQEDQTIDINKKDSRNLPSRKSGYTLLIGANANIFDQKNEFVTAYYDIGSLKHAEIYKEQILKSTDFIAKKRRRSLIRLFVIVIGLIIAGFLLKKMFEPSSVYKVSEMVFKAVL